MDHAKLLDVLTSLPVSQSILPRAIGFATSRPANHAICSFIYSSRYASGPIRRCLFIDYIIKRLNVPLEKKTTKTDFGPPSLSLEFLLTLAVCRLWAFFVIGCLFDLIVSLRWCVTLAVASMQDWAFFVF